MSLSASSFAPYVSANFLPRKRTALTIPPLFATGRLRPPMIQVIRPNNLPRRRRALRVHGSLINPLPGK
jgi:hypothetical protein